LSGICRLEEKKNKSKGKKIYKNTHGRMHRVVRNYKIRYMEKQKKMLRKLKAQHSKKFSQDLTVDTAKEARLPFS
jgi:hypothetical protein